MEMKDRWQEFRANLNRLEPEEQITPQWPPPIPYALFKKELIEKPRPIIDNLLDISSRMIFGGGSKTYKTWAMSDLALCSVVGAQWWGFDTFMVPCLYVNFELKAYYIQRRMLAIQTAKKLGDGPLYIWNLRGYSITLGEFKTELLKLIESLGVLLVFIDPFYKLLMGRDERVSAEINDILAAFDQINRLTGATVIFAAHFTKGNQSQKESIDRISGGGSINRDPDNLVTLTRHRTDYAFSIEFTLRDYAPIEPFVVRWQFPLLVRDDELDPADIKKPGRPAEYDASALIRIVTENDDQLQTVALVQKVEKELGWNQRTIYRKLDALRKEKRLFLSKATDCWNIPPPNQ
jgi:AAA domain